MQVAVASDACAVWFTDPPYYDAVPYSDLSDFFFVWLKRTLPDHPLLRDQFDSNKSADSKNYEKSFKMKPANVKAV